MRVTNIDLGSQTRSGLGLPARDFLSTWMADDDYTAFLLRNLPESPIGESREKAGTFRMEGVVTLTGTRFAPVAREPEVRLCYIDTSEVAIEPECAMLTSAPLSVRDYLQRWQRRIAELRSWRGDAHSGESSSISDRALNFASTLGAMTARLLAEKTSTVKTMLVPLEDGGVQAEWTARSGPSAEHFEVAIAAERADRFEILATSETSEGRITTIWRELDDASLIEVVAAFKDFVLRIPSTQIAR